MSQKAVFVSDLHLIGPDDSKTHLFTKFLKSLRAPVQNSSGGGDNVTHLFLVGDIFDLWVGDHDYFASRFSAVVTEIAELIRRGVEVHYFEGNHDLHLTKFWKSRVGAHVHKDSGVFQINDLTVRVEHGDLINPDDHGYLFLRKFLRSGPMTLLSMHLPEAAVKAIGERASVASRDYTTNAKGKPQDEIRQLIRTHAQKMSRESKFDLIITGHVHVSDDFTFDVDRRQVRSINLGSWYEPPRALVIDSAGIHFEPIF